MSKILAIHAHLDDVEILSGVTLALLAQRGHQITIATLTRGNNSVLPPGARYLCLEMQELAIFNDDSTRRRVVEILRKTRPDLVLAPSPSDAHCDRAAAGVLVRDACFGAPGPNYHTRHEHPAPALDAIPHLYFMDPVSGKDREGNWVVPDFAVARERGQVVGRLHVEGFRQYRGHAYPPGPLLQELLGEHALPFGPVISAKQRWPGPGPK